MDIETGDEYWISGVKQNGEDRHWAGTGKIQIDRKVIDEYLVIIKQKNIDLKKLEVVDIVDSFPVERINQLENLK
jgi:hypothetical protein